MREVKQDMVFEADAEGFTLGDLREIVDSTSSLPGTTKVVAEKAEGYFGPGDFSAWKQTKGATITVKTSGR